MTDKEKARRFFHSHGYCDCCRFIANNLVVIGSPEMGVFSICGECIKEIAELFKKHTNDRT